jgi:hypothetical protein
MEELAFCLGPANEITVMLAQADYDAFAGLQLSAQIPLFF